jgi:hypothetical protein
MTRITRAALLNRLGLGAAGLALLALMPTASFAGAIGPVKQVQAPSSVAKVDYRCWWSAGERQCAWFGDAPRVYGYYYDPYDEGPPAYRSRRPNPPEAYWPGTERWWKSMDEWGRAGNQ